MSEKKDNLTPEEIAKMQDSRILSDAELIQGGAKHVSSEIGQPRLEVTKKQRNEKSLEYIKLPKLDNGKEKELGPTIPPYSKKIYDEVIKEFYKPQAWKDGEAPSIQGKFPPEEYYEKRGYKSPRDALQAQFEIESVLEHRLKVGTPVNLSYRIVHPPEDGKEYRVLELLKGGYLIGTDKPPTRIRVPISVLEIENKMRTIQETFIGGWHLSEEDLNKTRE